MVNTVISDTYEPAVAVISVGVSSFSLEHKQQVGKTEEPESKEEQDKHIFKRQYLQLLISFFCYSVAANSS